MDSLQASVTSMMKGGPPNNGVNAKRNGGTPGREDRKRPRTASLDEKHDKSARSHPDNAPPPTEPGQVKLFIGNLHYKVTEDVLVQSFSTCGNIVWHRIIKQRDGTPRGIAFVTFENQQGADRAIAQFNGREFHGRELQVNNAIDRGETQNSRKPLMTGNDMDVRSDPGGGREHFSPGLSPRSGRGRGGRGTGRGNIGGRGPGRGNRAIEGRGSGRGYDSGYNLGRGGNSVVGPGQPMAAPMPVNRSYGGRESHHMGGKGRGSAMYRGIADLHERGQGYAEDGLGSTASPLIIRSSSGGRGGRGGGRGGRGSGYRGGGNGMGSQGRTSARYSPGSEQKLGASPRGYEDYGDDVYGPDGGYEDGYSDQHYGGGVRGESIYNEPGRTLSRRGAPPHRGSGARGMSGDGLDPRYDIEDGPMERRQSGPLDDRRPGSVAGPRSGPRSGYSGSGRPRGSGQDVPSYLDDGTSPRRDVGRGLGMSGGRDIGDVGRGEGRQRYSGGSRYSGSNPGEGHRGGGAGMYRGDDEGGRAFRGEVNPFLDDGDEDFAAGYRGEGVGTGGIGPAYAGRGGGGIERRPVGPAETDYGVSRGGPSGHREGSTGDYRGGPNSSQYERNVPRGGGFNGGGTPGRGNGGGQGPAQRGVGAPQQYQHRTRDVSRGPAAEGNFSQNYSGRGGSGGYERGGNVEPVAPAPHPAGGYGPSPGPGPGSRVGGADTPVGVPYGGRGDVVGGARASTGSGRYAGYEGDHMGRVQGISGGQNSGGGGIGGEGGGYVDRGPGGGIVHDPYTPQPEVRAAQQPFVDPRAPVRNPVGNAPPSGYNIAPPGSSGTSGPGGVASGNAGINMGSTSGYVPPQQSGGFRGGSPGTMDPNSVPKPQPGGAGEYSNERPGGAAPPASGGYRNEPTMPPPSQGAYQSVADVGPRFDERLDGKGGNGVPSGQNRPGTSGPGPYVELGRGRPYGGGPEFGGAGGQFGGNGGGDAWGGSFGGGKGVAGGGDPLPVGRVGGAYGAPPVSAAPAGQWHGNAGGPAGGMPGR